MDELLIASLRPVIRRQRWQALAWQLANAWSFAAIAGFGVIFAESATGRSSPLALPVLLGLACGASFVVVLRHRSRPNDYRGIAQRIELGHPELKGLLLTAVQQEVLPGKARGYLQHRLVEQAVEHGRKSDWRDTVPLSRLFLAQGVHAAALALFIFSLAGLRNLTVQGGPGGSGVSDEVVITPGDASLEKGESLVVLARFGGKLPPGVNLVVRTSGSAPRQIALVKSLADPVFGASIPEVRQDLTYHLDYAGGSSREYKVSVFEHPRLERADATLTYPTYTHLSPKRVENTRRVSAVEGTRLDLALQLNKPVASATLVARDAKKTAIALQVSPDKAVASLPSYALVATQSYDLQLVDKDGRTNALATPFYFDVLPDRPPELHVTAPRGDIRPSAIEEVTFSGTVLGDFGLSGYGLAYTTPGGATKIMTLGESVPVAGIEGSAPATSDTQVIELGREVPPKEKRAFNYLLSLETMGVKPNQLISWYLWADDMGPDGKTRRTTTDLYFAEIRPFDEIFRESKAMQESPGDPSGAGQGQGGEAQRLNELQKQIISATWKLQRKTPDAKFGEDTKVVGDSEQQALKQAKDSAEKAEDPRAKGLWDGVVQEMGRAVTHLQEAAKTPAALTPALIAEQAAYQDLLRLQARTTNVARGARGGGGGGGASQSQLNQLDLTQEQNRYETQRQASQAETPERREQLQVMNRLQELARRQQDVNDRLKELQTALQEAKTEQQREDIRRQLKRLQDEQQQMLADVDEVRQRMDRQENQTAMSEQRKQLDQTRTDVEKAADAAGQGKVAEALDSGTRAQRQFQDMHDALHKMNSSQFADDLRQMREQARELARQEEDVAKKLNPETGGAAQKRLSDSENTSGPVQQLDDQKKRLAELVNRAKEVSQQSENSEPLLAEKLYDSLRKLASDDSGTAKEFQQDLLNSGLLTRSINERLTDTKATEGTRALDLTSALVQEGYLPQAIEAEKRARAGIDELKTGIERAAESVIGDDTEALKLARSELDAVTNELDQEAGRNGGQADRQKGQGSQSGGKAASTKGTPRTKAGQPGPGEGGSGESNPDAVASAESTRHGTGEASDKTRRQIEERTQKLSANGQGNRSSNPSDGAGSAPAPGNSSPENNPGASDGENSALAQSGNAPGQKAQAKKGQGKKGGGQKGGSGEPGEAGDGSQSSVALDGAPAQGGQSGQAGAPGESSGAGQPGQGRPSLAQAGGQPRGGRQGKAGTKGGAGAGAGQGQQLTETANQPGGGEGDAPGMEDLLAGGGNRAGDATRGAGGPRGPITGDNFGPWSDRLRNVEEIVDSPDLRNAVAAARERARLLRQDYNRNLKKPDWAVIQKEVIQPLVEVRNHISDELARRESKDSLVPIDRDPVPNRYAESVRKYYEELGK